MKLVFLRVIEIDLGRISLETRDMHRFKNMQACGRNILQGEDSTGIVLARTYNANLQRARIIVQRVYAKHKQNEKKCV
jgi:hypothetical protein